MKSHSRFVLAISLILGLGFFPATNCFGQQTEEAQATEAVQEVQEAEETEEAQEDDGEDAEVVDMAMAVPMGVFGNGFGQKKSEMVALKKLDVMIRLELEISEIKSVCGLTEQQAKKLSVASKAVAIRQAKSWEDEMEQFQMFDMNMMNAEDEAADEEDEKDEEEEPIKIEDIDLNKVDPNSLQWLNINLSGETDSNAPMKDKIWKKAIKSVLDEAQIEKLAEHKKARVESLRKSTVAFFTDMYANELSLDAEEKAALAKAFDKALTEENAPKSVDETYNSIYALAQIPSEDLKKFMSNSQLKRWRILVGVYGGFGDFIEFEDEFEEEEVQEEDMEAADDDG